ncbi:hypothetical protein SFC65_20180 [Priestia filamentosa]|uniref:hypothetical protein n=1 Tax=Priestia filamentosa TaxID=1402861 RepID=UPI0039821BA5
MKHILKHILNTEEVKSYPLFREFCSLKEKGLRKHSFKTLSLFLKETEKWNQGQRQEFGIWLFSVCEESSEVHSILVHPFVKHLIQPTFDEWIETAPEDPRPYRWYGLFLNTGDSAHYLSMALELGGDKEQRALLTLIDIYINSLWYSFHHVSENFYLGKIEEDRELIKKVEQLNQQVDCVQAKKENAIEIEHYKSLLNDWVLFEKEGAKEFVEWCKNRGKIYPWTQSFYYE